MPPKHQLIQFRDALRVLSDLLLGKRVQDGQPSIHMPLLRVDAERKIDLHVLDPAYVAGYLPRELRVGVPGFAHGQEGGVGHGLGISGDPVVL